MNPVRLGAVGYLNARPLVFGLDHSSRFALRFDVPSRCATLLHGGGIDLGLIPSVEYLRGPAGGTGANDYRIVPGPAITSRGEVASVTLYASKAIDDVRSIAMDTSSRTSVALVRILCARAFHIQPEFHAHPPDLAVMLTKADAALIIGDNALFAEAVPEAVERFDLGAVWTEMTGLPFVYAFWVGRANVLTAADVRELQRARDEGVQNTDAIVKEYFADAPERRVVGAKYLRDNIKYDLGADEQAGLELFYRYAAEAGLVDQSQGLNFYD